MNKQVIDARGRSCPEPVILTKNALAALATGQLSVLLDAEVAKENVSRLAEHSGCQVEVKAGEVTGEYQVIITKG